MPEREFEIYLAAVSKLLRLSPEQKAAISDELRDHMEERLQELTADGLSHDEAIQKALDEFGDANGLAVEFSKAVQSRMRRVVMRTAAVTIVLLIAANALLHVLAPPLKEPDEPLHALLGASSQRLLAADKKPVENNDESKAALPIDWETLIPPELQQRALPMNFQEAPLQDIATFISNTYHVPIVLDAVAFEENGISSDEPLSVKVQPLPDLHWQKLSKDARQKYVDEHPEWSVSVAQTLDRLLHPNDLGWHVEDGVVVVTTRDVANDSLILRSWPVGDLLESGMTEQSLIDTLQFMTHGHWEDTDGQGGTMQLVGTILNVRQTFQTQREIEQLLPALRHRGKASTLLHPKQYWEIRRKLELKTGDVDFVDLPLNDAVQFLAEMSLLDFRIDIRALEDEGLSADAPVTLKMGQRPLRTVLKFMLKPLELDVTITDGRPTITTIEEAQENLHTVIYDIRGMDGPNWLPRLTTALMETTDGLWEQVDGEGGVLLAPGGGRLLVRQDLRTQTEVSRLLVDHRRFVDALGGKAPPPEKPRLELRVYRMPEQSAEDLLKVLPQLVAPKTWGAANQFQPGNFHPDLQDGKDDREKVIIRKVAVGPKIMTLKGQRAKQVDANPKNKGQANGNAGRKQKKTQETARELESQPNIVVIPEAVLIIRQTPDVHEKIDVFLQRMGLEAQGQLFDPNAKPRGGLGGGGGFF